jgi:hypothetical protein
MASLPVAPIYSDGDSSKGPMFDMAATRRTRWLRCASTSNNVMSIVDTTNAAEAGGAQAVNDEISRISTPTADEAQNIAVLSCPTRALYRHQLPVFRWPALYRHW